LLAEKPTKPTGSNFAKKIAEIEYASCYLLQGARVFSGGLKVEMVLGNKPKGLPWISICRNRVCYLQPVVTGCQ
jgi:hypothetical protein